jgi:hypothetical protein
VSSRNPRGRFREPASQQQILPSSKPAKRRSECEEVRERESRPEQTIWRAANTVHLDSSSSGSRGGRRRERLLLFLFLWEFRVGRRGRVGLVDAAVGPGASNSIHLTALPFAGEDFSTSLEVREDEIVQSAQVTKKWNTREMIVIRSTR